MLAQLLCATATVLSCVPSLAQYRGVHRGVEPRELSCVATSHWLGAHFWFPLLPLLRPHSFGYRARTRDMFARPFRKSGTIALGVYTKPLKVGDIVDIVVNGACHKGMPHRFYHGRTGVIFNVSRRGVGVEVNKLVRGRILKKAINVRVEHVRPSNSRKGFLDRVEKNETLKREAKAKGEVVNKALLKRIPEQPRAGYVVKAQQGDSLPVVITPKPFDEML